MLCGCVKGYVNRFDRVLQCFCSEVQYSSTQLVNLTVESGTYVLGHFPLQQI